jgi:signal peptidase I
MKKVFYLTILLLLFYSCQSGIDDKIKNYIDAYCVFDNCGGWLVDKNIHSSYIDTCGTCYIDLKKVLNIDYDKVYMFGEMTTAEDIERTIGVPYDNNTFLSDSKYRIIFIKNNKIVYDDDFYQKNVHFNTILPSYDENNCPIPSNDIHCLLDTSSIYEVRKNVDKNGYNYSLHNVR